MTATPVQSLRSFLRDHGHGDPLQELHAELKNAQHAQLSRRQIDRIIRLYRQSLPAIEQALWSSGPNDKLLTQYQNIFRELERLIAIRGDDHRHDFIVVIPVADRPRHLMQCLQSLLTLCQRYQYGGFADNRYSKVSVIVADDSRQSDNIARHRQICGHFTENGLATEYFGEHEQKHLLKSVAKSRRPALAAIVGQYAQNPDTTSFSHKGASVTRNIAYLRLNQLVSAENRHRTLIYFIDSDQEFRIKVPSGNSARGIYAINYFHHLDDIFTRGNVTLLTGKVVGDPPVSPAVMAGKFQDDVIDFLRHLATAEPHQDCTFHTRIGHETDDAAYHDMSELFGFSNSAAPCAYHCSLPLPHDHRACLGEFAGRLNRFFDGEHPTRVTYFSYSGPLSDTTPARTIYTGNYVFRPEILDHFIAFATLKLRMTGPALGRLLRSEIGGRFVSANLPMLHNRTVDETGLSEYRPGVNRSTDNIDLAREFERQFYGDVMLFTVDRLTQSGYPARHVAESFIRQTLETTDTELRAQYRHKHAHIVSRLAELKHLHSEPSQWWNGCAGMEATNAEFSRFISNIEHNFGPAASGYELIDSDSNRRMRHDAIVHAITHYAQDRFAWHEILNDAPNTL